MFLFPTVLPVVGPVSKGADTIGAGHLRKSGISVFVLEVTETPVPELREMASVRGDGVPFYWRVPMEIWPSLVTYMQYMAEGEHLIPFLSF